MAELLTFSCIAPSNIEQLAHQAFSNVRAVRFSSQSPLSTLPTISFDHEFIDQIVRIVMSPWYCNKNIYLFSCYLTHFLFKGQIYFLTTILLLISQLKKYEYFFLMNRNQITKGRPLDNMLEKEFKEKVREKYQTICSECQLEMSLAKHDIQEDRALNSELFDHSEQNLQVLLLQIGLENEKKMWMHQRFCSLRDQWIFEDIKCGQSLPEYLFHGKSDLSYILHRIQTQFFQAEPALEIVNKRFEENLKNIDFQSSCQKISQSKSLPSSPLFEAEELMFLFLLCIKQRKMLSQPIIYYYQENMKIFTQLLNRGLEKIKKKISSKQNLEAEEMNIDKYLNLQSQAKDHQKVRKINKKIYKPEHKKSKKEKNLSSQDKSASEVQTAYDLCIKSVNYICWAYWYILNKNVQNQ